MKFFLKMKELLQRFTVLQHSFIYTLGTIVSGSISLITFPILARLISVKEFGEYDFFLFLLLTAAPMSSLGIDYGIGAFASQLKLKQIGKILLKILPMTSTLVLIFTTAVFIAKTVNIFQTFSYGLILLWGICLAMLSISTLLKSAFLWKQHPVRAAIVMHGEWTMASVLGLCSIILLGASIKNYLLGFTIAFSLSSIAAILLWPKRENPFTKEKTPIQISIKDLIKISLPYAITNTLFVLSLGIEKSIILKMLGPDALGIYAMANKVGSIAQLIGINFILGFLPHLIEDRDTRNLFTLLFKIYFGFSIIALTIVTLFHKQIILFFGGHKYIRFSYLLIYTTISSLLSLIPYGINAHLLKHKHTLPILYYGISSTVIIIISSIVLLPRLQLIGATTAVILGRLIGITNLYFAIKRRNQPSCN